MAKKKLITVKFDEDFVREFRILAAAQNKSMAALSRDLGTSEGEIKRFLERWKFQ